MLMAEPCAETAEAADDLVGNEQNVPLPADARDLRPIGRRRDDNAACPLHWLGDERGDIILAQFVDLLFQFAGNLQAEFLRREIAAFGIPIGLADMDDARDRQITLLMHVFHAAHAGAGNRGAVIAVPAGNNGLLRRLAHGAPINPGHPEPGIVGLGTGVGEEDMVEPRTGMGADLLGKQRCGRGRSAEEGVVIGQFIHLPGNGIGDFGAAIADVHAPEACKPVQIFPPFRIEDMNALSTLDDPRTIRIQFLHVGKGMQVMGGIKGGEIGAA